MRLCYNNGGDAPGISTAAEPQPQHLSPHKHCQYHHSPSEHKNSPWEKGPWSLGSADGCTLTSFTAQTGDRSWGCQKSVLGSLAPHPPMDLYQGPAEPTWIWRAGIPLLFGICLNKHPMEQLCKAEIPQPMVKPNLLLVQTLRNHHPRERQHPGGSHSFPSTRERCSLKST